MKWKTRIHGIWDVGEIGKTFSLSKANLSNVMRALILCEGKMLCSHCMDKESGSSKLMYAKDSLCAAVIRISIPIGAETEFQSISGMKLSNPPQIKGS